MMTPPGVVIASTVTTVAAVGFIPVAVHFDLFALLVQSAKPVTSEQLMKACHEQQSEEAKRQSPLCLRLTQDTMFIMSGIGFVDTVAEDTFAPNAVTQLMVSMPSAQHGALHSAVETLLASAFLMRKLVDSRFQYPFREKETPMQYAYHLMGNEQLAQEHTYSIMHLQGRMDSFNTFMDGKFGRFGRMPDRVQNLGYDLDAAISDHHEGHQSAVVMVDIGGGRGELLLDLKHAYPHLQPSHLVVQEFHADVQTTADLTIMEWNFKDGSPQPIHGARIYSLQHIFHNLPDLDALELMQKIARAMAPYSRLLVHEFSKNVTYGKMHATMIELYGGRIRSGTEWKRMAGLAGLRVTFEAYPALGEGLIEMRKGGG